ncbi:complement factor H-related protein 4-like [Erythrolamprus reginae]|uniref:complement factor H-related protein 4-like n=1 Tax=Erythrolamprus reginae TaxID=121349 RepID=UPI00396CA351
MKNWLLLVAAFLLLPGYSSQNVCEEPDDIDFGEIVTTGKAKYLENDQVQYSCYPGYVLEGPEWIQCRGQEWTPHPPKCLAPCHITRQQLATKNLFVFGGQRRKKIIPSNQNLQFQCNEGYVLVAPSVRKCADGHMELPLCISEQGEKCNSPPRIENGDIITLSEKQYRSGSSVEFRCQNYYAMEGQNISFCDNGNWTKVPICLEITCNPPRISNGYFQSRRTIYYDGDLIRIQCDSGFILENDNGEKVIECTKNGWSPSPKCIQIECSRPHVKFGRIQSSQPLYRNNEEIEINCVWPFFRKKVSKCTANGWDPPVSC